MPGQTTNDNLVAASNQSIVSLNELIEALTNNANDPDRVATIAAEIKNVLTTLDSSVNAQLLAMISSNNVNAANMVNAIEGIEACADIILRQSFSIDLSTEIEATEGTEMQPPPDNWVETPETPGGQEYFERKCKAANQIINGFAHVWAEYDSVNLSALLAVSVGLMSNAIRGIMTAPVTGPLALVVAFAGAVVGIAERIISGSFDFGALASMTTGNRSDLVCALYDATSASAARSDLVAEYTNLGASADEVDLIDFILSTTGACNALFFDRELADYPNPRQVTATVDCSNCASVCVPTVFWGTCDFTPGLRTWTAEFRDLTGSDPHYIIHLCHCPTDNNPDIDLEFKAITGYTGRGPSFWDFRLHSTCGPIGVQGDIYLSNATPPPLDTPFCFNQMIFWSLTPFTVDVDISGTC